MKGTDVTAAELAHAEEFLKITNNYPPQQFVFKRDQLINLLAWYGSIRAEGGKAPGQLVKVSER